MTGRTKPRRANAAAGPEETWKRWFAEQGWKPFPFQSTVWQHIAQGESGLLHASTGAGKTLAVWLGAVQAFGGADLTATLDCANPIASPVAAKKVAPSAASKRAPPPPPLTVLWITPMRALAADTVRALRAPLDAIGSTWQVGLRTGDTSSAERARQDRRLPTTLVTTPESLTLLLTRNAARELLSSVRMIVVDEWHELIGNKRGVQTQLALARMSAWQPALQIWGLSATLGDLALAKQVLLAGLRRPDHESPLVQGMIPKTRIIDTLIPETMERFPWAGHLGSRLVAAVAQEIDQGGSALVFTNTRSQAEIWYQALLAEKPDWAGLIALHHSSLDASVRHWVEGALKEGKLRVVVCTSSLDLGVDFSPVDRVFQVGSPKGIARLLQRAGRSGHSPGRPSRVTIVPTHALELLEAAAARKAVEEGHIESRHPPHAPLDVLVQHLVTVALGGGFHADALYDEVRHAWSYRHLSKADFAWALAFVENGGASLGAYPEYHRVAREPIDANNANGPATDTLARYHVPRADLARRHRANIGTIVADAAMRIEWVSGGRIGTVEESFISRLRPGNVFTFAGRTVELVRVHNMTAYVKRASSTNGAIPQWQGGRMPLSSELADSIIGLLGDARQHAQTGPEMTALAPLLELQERWSELPHPGMLLMESIKTREGWHCFCYPFAGRTAHVGLAALIAWRAARISPNTFSLSVNDYGFELLSATPVDWPALVRDGLFDYTTLDEDILASLNASELASRRFREIARIAGLVFQSHPGEGKTARQLQASSSLFYQVFLKHDPENRLLEQARHEVLEQELDIDRIHEALQRMARQTVTLTLPPKPTPFAFPLMVGRLRERISTEKLGDRVQRMLMELERAAGMSSASPTLSSPPKRTRKPAVKTASRILKMRSHET